MLLLVKLLQPCSRKDALNEKIRRLVLRSLTIKRIRLREDRKVSRKRRFSSGSAIFIPPPPPRRVFFEGNLATKATLESSSRSPRAPSQIYIVRFTYLESASDRRLSSRETPESLFAVPVSPSPNGSLASAAGRCTGNALGDRTPR